MSSAIIKRSVVIAGKNTSISLEEIFWQGVKEIAVQKRLPFVTMLDTIAAQRDTPNLSSAIRQYVMQYFYNIVMQPHHHLPNALPRPHFVMLYGNEV